MTSYVSRFRDGDKDQKDLLGGKGANLAEMTNLDLPVPPGFTITTEACRAYMRDGHVPPELRVEVTLAVREIEDTIGRRLGDFHEPLLVSVRSGAKFSMPGMMETVLNIGLNDASVKGLDRVLRRRAVRVGLLPAAHPDVRQDRARDRRRRCSRRRWTSARPRSAPRPTSTCPRRTCACSCRRSRRSSSSRRAASSRSTRASSSTWRSRPSSTPGTPTARGSTGGASASRTTWAPRSTS